MTWIIKGHDGAEDLFEFHAATETPEGDVAAILQRLVCSGLSHADVLNASFPQVGGHRIGALDITREDSGHGRLLSTVGHPWFTAQHQPVTTDP